MSKITKSYNRIIKILRSSKDDGDGFLYRVNGRSLSKELEIFRRHLLKKNKLGKWKPREPNF